MQAFPEHLEHLELPFGKEYEFALVMVGMGGGLISGLSISALLFSYLEYSGESVPLILEESVPPNSGWI